MADLSTSSDIECFLKTKIDGLWLTGQDILTCGVTGAMMAGLMTTTAMIGMRRMGPVMKKIFG
jgi:hypothetical protein